MSLLLYCFQRLKPKNLNPNQNRPKNPPPTTKKLHSSHHHHCPASPQHNPQHFIYVKGNMKLTVKSRYYGSSLLLVFLQEVKTLLNVMSLLLHYCYYCYSDYKIWGWAHILYWLKRSWACFPGIWHSSSCLSRSLDLTKACVLKAYLVTALLVVTLISQASFYFGFHIVGVQQLKFSHLKIKVW